MMMHRSAGGPSFRLLLLVAVGWWYCCCVLVLYSVGGLCEKVQVAVDVEGDGYADDYSGYDGYEDEADSSSIAATYEVNNTEFFTSVRFQHIKSSLLTASVIPLVSIADDNALNETRLAFRCRPDPEKAAERVQYRIEKRKRENRDVMDDVIDKLNDKVAKNELSEVQARIAKLTLKKDKSKLKADLEAPKLQEVNETYMNTNMSMLDINVTRDLEILNETIHNATMMKKLTYRERAHMKQKLKQTEWETKSSQIFTVPLGLTCEGLICSSCKSIVNEYVYAHLKSLREHNIPRSAKAIINQGFCNSYNMTQYYAPLVSSQCNKYYLNVSWSTAKLTELCVSYV
jgi:hypothetical protein